jgi:DNA-binding transcriptional LysR family regulator
VWRCRPHSSLTDLNDPRLLAGELDLYFGTLPQVESLPDYLIATPLLKVRSRMIAGAQHPLVRKKKNVTPADLARYPWAMLHHDREVTKRVLAVLDQAGDGKVGVSVELTSLAAMVQLLQAGPYLACFAKGMPMLQPQLGLATLAYPKPVCQHQAGVVMHRPRALRACAGAGGACAEGAAALARGRPEPISDARLTWEVTGGSRPQPVLPDALSSPVKEHLRASGLRRRI